MSVYLDYNASAPIDERVVDAMMDVYKNYYGNADSRTHDYGENARELVDHARQSVAELLKVKKEEVFFTSGATESDNIAILGMEDFGNKTGKKHVIISSIEHKAVLEAANKLGKRGFDIEQISPNEDGRINVDTLLSHVRDDTLMVSVMHVNNETGIIQPVEEIGNALYDKDIYFHVDATQSCGKLVDEIRFLKYDMLSMSAHKMSGPQGIGALILKRKRYKLPPVSPIIYGGHQESGIRPGTTPVALVVGFGVACDIAMNNRDEMENCLRIKKRVLELLDNSGLAYDINGDPKYCMPITINFSIRGVSSEALMLSSKQYCSISNGSACTSKEYSLSYVLKAMGLSEERMESALRVSWGYETDIKEVEAGFSHLLDVAKDLVIGE
ncbi:MAG: cysteine desulfurase [Odoribacter sp.]|nr:cysteine desulfurase [Odoribacter sp.]